MRAAAREPVGRRGVPALACARIAPFPLDPRLAPIKAAVLPLSRNEKLVPTAREVWEMLRPHFMTSYDDAQSIGRRYRRQDEIGTPFCVTVDFESLEDKAVTIRERDSMEQVRVPISGLVEALKERLPVC